MSATQIGRHLDLYLPSPAPRSLENLLDRLPPTLPDRSLEQSLEHYSTSLLRHRRPIV